MSKSESPENALTQTAGSGSKQYQAAGNINIIHNSDNHYNQYLKLVEEFEKELASEQSPYREIIAKIRHFTSNIDGDKIIGLEKKLENAGFESDFTWARDMKEQYFKKITENNLSKATQKIHAFLLARTCVLFNLHVRGAINDGMSKDVIKDLLIEKVINPVQNMVGENNVLDLLDDDLIGMMYFLTGNCHITWK
jgi:hypothetical protein